MTFDPKGQIWRITSGSNPKIFSKNHKKSRKDGTIVLLVYVDWKNILNKSQWPLTPKVKFWMSLPGQIREYFQNIIKKIKERCYFYFTCVCRLRKIYWTNPSDLWPKKSNFKGHFRVKFEIFSKNHKRSKKVDIPNYTFPESLYSEEQYTEQIQVLKPLNLIGHILTLMDH